jgi:pleiotropic regulator 1
MHFWDYKTGYNFQTAETKVQPGSLDSEAGIFCSAFDQTGLRLITGEADKTIKIWKEDELAVSSFSSLRQCAIFANSHWMILDSRNTSD